MKKYICIILVCVIIGLLVVSFTSTPDSVENPIDKPPAIDFATTPPPTISEKTEFGDDDEIKNDTHQETIYELLQSDNTITESYSDVLEYEAKLHELGFTEMYFGTDYCKPVSLTYNEQAFCLEFSYYDDNHRKEDNWVLYGTRSDSNQNITKYSENNLPSAFTFNFDFMERVAPEQIRKMPICPQIQEIRSRDDLTNPSFVLNLYLIYYPTSNNLYNCYREGGAYDYAYIPGIIKPWYVVLEDYYATLDLPQFYFVVNKLVNKENKSFELDPYVSTTLLNVYCPFESGMTLQDWVDSPYNFEGWTWFAEGSVSGMISPKNRADVYVVIAEHHDDGSLYTIDEYLSNRETPGVPIMTYDDFLVMTN